jgi:hypothetical protein
MANFAAPSYAETPAGTSLNKHFEKLLGTWRSSDGDVTFNANNTIVYKGKKHFCAIAQGTIQISLKKTSSILPYRFLDGKLLITDGGSVTTYTRVP